VFAVHVENPVKRYNRRNVLAGVNLDVAEGEFYALMGPNGSGKTTLASIVAAAKAQDGGTVGFTARSPQIDQQSSGGNNDRRRYYSSNGRHIGAVCSIPILARATSDVFSSVAYLFSAGLNGIFAGRAKYGCL
jgi:ABC-type Fe3+/spermidine/putrescine transport system ATPase subunit